MNLANVIRVSSLTLALSGLAACGGGGTSTAGSAGDTRANTDLRIGMLVTVKGSRNDDGTGTATKVIYRDELQGPVTAIDTASGSFEVMGLTVSTDSATRFSRCSDDGIPPVVMDLARDLAVNDLVEVSGYRTANGVQATYVELKDNSCTDDDKDEVEIKGTLATDGSFSLADGSLLSFDTNPGCIDPITLVGMGLSGFVELKGAYSGSVFCVNSAEAEEEHSGLDQPGQETFEVEGIVSDLDTSAQTFMLNGLLVYYGSATLEVSPSNGLRLEIEGTVNSDQSISASRVKLDS